MEALPLELVTIILSFLASETDCLQPSYKTGRCENNRKLSPYYLTTLARCKLVCQAFNSAISTPGFIQILNLSPLKRFKPKQEFIFNLFSQFSKITYLDLSYCQISSTIFIIIAQCKFVTSLVTLKIKAIQKSNKMEQQSSHRLTTDHQNYEFYPAYFLSLATNLQKLQICDSDWFRRLGVLKPLSNSSEDSPSSTLSSSRDQPQIVTSIQSLTFQNCSKFSYIGILETALCFPNLTSLNIFGCRNISDDVFHFLLGKNSPTLQKLVLGGFQKITETGLAHFLKHSFHLQKLSLNLVEKKLDFAECLLRPELIVSLEIKGALNDQQLIHIAIHLISISKFVFINNLSNLVGDNNNNPNSSNDGSNGITDKGIEGFCDNLRSQLKTWVMKFCGFITDAKVSKSIRKNFNKFTSLEKCDFQGSSEIGDKTFQSILIGNTKSKNKNQEERNLSIKSLDFRSCMKLTDKGLEVLETCREENRIKSIRIENQARVTNFGVLTILENCRELETLDLEMLMNINEEWMKQCMDRQESFEELDILSVQGSKNINVTKMLEWIDSVFPKLRMLNIYKCTFSPEKLVLNNKNFVVHK